MATARGKTAPVEALLILAGVMLTIIAYLPAMDGPFMLDEHAIIHNPLLQTLGGLYTIWLNPSQNHVESHYWPLTYTVLWLEWQLLALDTFGYHAVNLLLHIVNMVLAWRILRFAWPLQNRPSIYHDRGSLRAMPGQSASAAPALAATIWALLPVQAESVAWIIEIKNLLATFLALAAMLCLLQHEESGRRGYYALGLLLFVASLISKSMHAALPLAVPLIYYARSGSFQRAILLRMVPLLFVALFYSALDVRFVSKTESLRVVWAQRLTLWGPCLWYYLWNSITASLNPLPTRWDITPTFASCLGLAWIALLTLLWRAGFRSVFAALCVFILLLLPVLGFIPFQFQQSFALVADRFEYLAALPIAALLAAGIILVSRRLPGVPSLLPLLTLVILTTLTWRQAGIWSSEVRYWRHAVEGNRPNVFTLDRLGVALDESGNHLDAIQSFQSAIRLDGFNPQPRLDLTAALARDGQIDAAKQEYEAVLKLSPKYPLEENRIGLAFRERGETSSSLAHFRRAFQIQPDYIDARVNYADTLRRLGRSNDAAAEYNRVLTIYPNHPAALRALEAMRSSSP